MGNEYKVLKILSKEYNLSSSTIDSLLGAWATILDEKELFKTIKKYVDKKIIKDYIDDETILDIIDIMEKEMG